MGLAQACPNYVCKTLNLFDFEQVEQHLIFTDLIGASISKPHNCESFNNIIFIIGASLNEPHNCDVYDGNKQLSFLINFEMFLSHVFFSLLNKCL